MVGSTVRHLDKLRNSASELQAQVARVERWDLLQRELGETGRSAEAVRRKLDALEQEMGSGDAGNLDEDYRTLRAEWERTQTTADATRAEIEDLERAMDGAGDEVRAYGRDQVALNRALESQVGHLGKLDAAVERRDQVRQRRGELRGRLFDDVALGVAVVAPIKLAIGAAVEFESVMADVAKVVDFETPAQFAGMSRDVLELSERIPVAAAGIGDIVAAAGQAGIAREELTRFAEDAAKVAVAFDISGREAGGSLTGLRTIFQLGQDQVMDLAGAYNHLSNNMDATAPAMLNITNRVGAVARDFGLTGEATGALGATFLALKTPPEIASTAINALLLKLQNAPEQSKKFQEALGELGLDAEGLKEDIGTDAQGALLAFLETVDKADDKSAILFNLFGQEYVDDITKLAGGLDLYREALRLSGEEAATASSIQAEYEQRAATTENQLDLLQNKANNLGVKLGSALLPALNDIVGGLGGVLGAAADLAERFPAATRVVTGLALGLVGLRLGTTVARYGWTFVAEGIETVRMAALRGRGAAASFGIGLGNLERRAIPGVIGQMKWLRIALLTTGIGAIAVGIGVAAALIIKYWEPISAFFAGVGRGIVAALAPIFEAFEPLAPLFGWLGDVFSWVADAVGSLFAPVESTSEQLDKVGSAGESVGKLIGTAFRVILFPITTVANVIGRVLKWLGILEDTEPEIAITDGTGVPETTRPQRGRLTPPPVDREPVRKEPDLVLRDEGRGTLAIARPQRGRLAAPAGGRAGALVASALVASAPAAAPVSPVSPVSPVPVAASESPATVVVDDQALSGEGTARPPGLDLPPPPPPPPRAAPRQSNIRVEAPIVIQSNDPQAVAEKIQEEMDNIMRRAAVEAGLGEDDEAYF